MHPKEISIKDFTYELPIEKIAQYPLPERDSSKLLIYSNGNIQSDKYSNLDHYLPENSFLVFNNSKVIEARIFFQLPAGGSIEIFCLGPDDKYLDISTALSQKGKVEWKCLVGGAKKWKQGLLSKQIINGAVLSVEKKEKHDDYFLIEFIWNDEALCFADILHYSGQVPLPPYLNRNTEESDKESYQTVYAKHDGSVAAPTAGLHFTENLFRKLDAKKIDHAFVTLHVSAGTFKPVKSETLETHEMHAEFFSVDRPLIRKLMEPDKAIVSVGTTSLRVIESLYWMGVKINKLLRQSGSVTIQDISIRQWDPYNLNDNIIPAKDALQALLNWMKGEKIEQLVTQTQIIIAPGYTFQIINGLITNFHQPGSTLLLLVAALVGDDWKKIYNYALENDFRFLSYGDGGLLWKQEHTESK